jgi:xanthine dehydrogenase YagR molybdenum-binding subunit
VWESAFITSFTYGKGEIGRDGRNMPIAEAFSRLGVTQIETLAQTVQEGAVPDALEKLRQGKLVLSSQERTVRWAYGAQFAELRVHEITGEIRATRLVGSFSADYIVNRLTAVDQLRGGMIWGIGSALLEATEMDTRLCRYVNDNLAEYHVAAAADTCGVSAVLLDADSDPDPEKLMGLGELGIIGVNAAIANAFYDATGRRVRDLPIRVDDAL